MGLQVKASKQQLCFAAHWHNRKVLVYQSSHAWFFASLDRNLQDRGLCLSKGNTVWQDSGCCRWQ